MQEQSSLSMVPDHELLERLSALLRSSRRTEADLVAHIGEIDRRRLYARAAAPSMFAYCVEVLHLSEAEAYLRIAAARAARLHPQLLAMLGDGRLHLSAIAKLSPHLTPENRDVLLRRATHRSKREIEELVAEIRPRPDAPCLVRRLPERLERRVPPPALSSAVGKLGWAAQPSVELDGGSELRPDGVGAAVPSGALVPSGAVVPSGAPVRALHAESETHEPGRVSWRSIVEPLAPSRYKVQFTASAELRDKLERLQALLRAEIPDGDLGAVIDRAVTQTLERLEARRYARTRAPRTSMAGAVASGSATSRPDIPTPARRIPAAVRRAVFERDGGRCRYRDETGRRCTERHRLEYHHVHPFAMGGDHGVGNLRLMCRSHNLHLAERDYGRAAMAVYQRPIQEAVVPPPCNST
jgi:5-methylcytosine-specific restriction endonuclease McrA